MTKINGALLVALATLLLTACQNMQGELKGDYYYSPAAAYALDLSVNTFRGKVVLDERCDRTGGSTTFWDKHGRMFRIDYLDVKDNPLVNAPRFASDMTLLNLVLNNYLRERLAKSPIITSVEAAHREFLDDTTPKSVFAIVKLAVSNKKAPAGSNVPDGTYYYGFLLFKKGDIIYIVQHRQPILAPANMKAILLKLAGAMDIPGKHLDPTEMDRMRHMLSRLAPGGSVSPIRMCAFDRS
jgi:hypothetical protein